MKVKEMDYRTKISQLSECNTRLLEELTKSKGIPIGLTRKQLIESFGESVSKRYNEVLAEYLSSENGVNPSTEMLLDNFLNHYHVSREQSFAIVLIVSALLDIIAKNNEYINSSIKHLTSKG